MTSGTHIPFLGVSELHSFAQLPQLFRFAAPAMEAICMGCKDSSCSFEPLRLKRRELNDLDVLLDGKGHGPLEAHLGKSGNLGLSDHGQDPNTVLVGGDWSMAFMTFHILGFSSSQLTKSYFSKGLKPPEFCLRTGDGRSRKALGGATWILGSDRSMVNFTKWGKLGAPVGDVRGWGYEPPK
jgi:hypothetical protein